jgi:hypothetical protein
MVDATGSFTDAERQALAEQGNRIATEILEKGLAIDGTHTVMSLLNLVQAMVVRRLLDGIGDSTNFVRGNMMLEMSMNEAKNLLRHIKYDVPSNDIN